MPGIGPRRDRRVSPRMIAAVSGMRTRHIDKLERQSSGPLTDVSMSIEC